MTNDDSYESLRLSIKAIGGGIWDYTIDRNMLVCNAKWYQIVGCEIGSITTIEQWKPLIHPEDAGLATAVDEETIDALIAHDQPYHVQFRICRPDGAIRWLRSVACVIRDAPTGLRRAVGCVTDITDLRHGGLAADAEKRLRPDFAADDRSRYPASGAAAPVNLSPRECECLRWVSVGKTAWETAVIMGRSRRTIEFHLANATRKLSASNKIHAAFIAVRLGLLAPHADDHLVEAPDGE